MEKITLCRIRKCLQNNIGNRVKVTVKKSRNKTFILDGIIENTHPSVFTVQLVAETDTTYQKRVSYSYSDLLTKSVELVIASPSKIASAQDQTDLSNDKMIV